MVGKEFASAPLLYLNIEEEVLMNFIKFVRLKGWLCLTLVLFVFLSGIPLSNQVALAAPATPTGLTAIPFKLKDAPDANHVNLKWNVISNAESYKLFDRML